MSATTSRVEWLKQRRTGIGGSDIAAILGLSPWATPLDVYLEKRSTQEPTEGGSEPMRWGTLLENVVAQEYADRTAQRVQRVKSMLRHPQHALAFANIDRAIVDEGKRARVDTRTGWLAGARGLLEVKCVGAFSAHEWGDDDASIPVHYAAQGMWYMGVTGTPWVEFAALIAGQKLVTRRLERDDATIAAMIQWADTFWHRHVRGGIPPDPVNASDALRVNPRHSERVIELDSADIVLRTACADLVTVAQQRKQIEQQFDELSGRVKVAMLDAGAITYEGKPLITWRANKDGTDTDWQGAATELAALYDDARAQNAPSSADVLAKHVTTTPGTRRFIVK